MSEKDKDGQEYITIQISPVMREVLRAILLQADKQDEPKPKPIILYGCPECGRLEGEDGDGTCQTCTPPDVLKLSGNMREVYVHKECIHCHNKNVPAGRVTSICDRCLERHHQFTKEEERG